LIRLEEFVKSIILFIKKIYSTIYSTAKNRESSCLFASMYTMYTIYSCASARVWPL